MREQWVSRAKGRESLAGWRESDCGSVSLGEITLAKSGEWENIIHFLFLLLEEK